MAHTVSVPLPKLAAGNGDQSCRDARERLGRFAVEFVAGEHPQFRALGIGPIDEAGLKEAAEEVLAAHQRDLLVLGSPVEPDTARKLARDRHQAITALIYIGSDKSAKEKLLRITDGTPLTICMGDRYRIGGNRIQRPVQTMLGEVTFAVDGCRAIFPDVVRTDGGKMWPGLCPDCRNAHSKPPRTQSRALKRRLNRIWEGRSARLYGSSVTLPLDVYEQQEGSKPMTAEERTPAKPGPDTKTPIVTNPSTPGIQKPGNKPDGRDDPREGETR